MTHCRYNALLHNGTKHRLREHVTGLEYKTLTWFLARCVKKLLSDTTNGKRNFGQLR